MKPTFSTHVGAASAAVMVTLTAVMSAQADYESTVYEGMTVPLSVAVDENSTHLALPTLVCQWTKNGTNLPGATATGTLTSGLTLTNVNFSVAFWIKFTIRYAAPGDLPFLANNNSSMGDIGVTLAPSYGRGGWSWSLNDSMKSKPWPGIGLYDPVGNTINDGNWHHLVHTFDRAGAATTYLDGLEVHSMSILSAAGWNLDTGLPWNIGQASGTYGENGIFELDDLGIWRRVLSPTEAQAVYLVAQKYGRTFDTYGPVMLTLGRSVMGLELIWQAGTLLSADDIRGPWTPVTGTSAPYYQVTPSTTQKFYRVQL